MADPTYADGQLLAVTHLLHDDSVREAIVTYAVVQSAAVDDAQGWADFLQDKFQDNLKALIDNAVVIERTTTLLGDGTSTFTTGESTATGTRGTLSGNTLPSNSAVLGKKVTGFGGRRNRGRIYFPWMATEGFVDELGGMDTGLIADIQAGVSAWLADINDIANANMNIANRVYDRAWDVPGRRLVSVDSGPVVGSINIERTIATQRRRMPRA